MLFRKNPKNSSEILQSVAVMDKFTRAKLAVESGVDLVIELPVPYAVAPAEVFALGGVALLSALPNVTEISFGSECGDLELLHKVSAHDRNNGFSPIFPHLLNLIKMSVVRIAYECFLDYSLLEVLCFQDGEQHLPISLRFQYHSLQPLLGRTACPPF